MTREVALRSNSICNYDPDEQRSMAKRAGAGEFEVKGSHAVYVSQPAAVADLVERAANAGLRKGKFNPKLAHDLP